MSFKHPCKADYTWGLCYEPYELRFNETYWECDGMIGMVNRSEIDIGLGEYERFKKQLSISCDIKFYVNFRSIFWDLEPVSVC